MYLSSVTAVFTCIALGHNGVFFLYWINFAQASEPLCALIVLEETRQRRGNTLSLGMEALLSFNLHIREEGNGDIGVFCHAKHECSNA